MSPVSSDTCYLLSLRPVTCLPAWEGPHIPSELRGPHRRAQSAALWGLSGAHSGTFCGPLGAVLRTFRDSLGPLLGRCETLLGASGFLKGLWSSLDQSRGVFGRSGGPLAGSWGPLGGLLGRFGGPLGGLRGLSLAVLKPSGSDSKIMVVRSPLRSRFFEDVPSETAIFPEPIRTRTGSAASLSLRAHASMDLQPTRMRAQATRNT